MKQSLKLKLGAFTLDALVEGDHRAQANSTLVAPRITRAIRYYLAEKGSERPGWAYPSFLDAGHAGERIPISLEIDAALWAELEREAERQQVAAGHLAEHAVHYFTADQDSGRVTQRILDQLEDEG